MKESYMSDYKHSILTIIGSIGLLVFVIGGMGYTIITGDDSIALFVVLGGITSGITVMVGLLCES